MSIATKGITINQIDNELVVNSEKYNNDEAYQNAINIQLDGMSRMFKKLKGE